MITIHKIFKGSFIVAAISSVFLLSSCESFVELGPPPTQTVLGDVFKTDASASSAVQGLYTGTPMPTMISNYSFFLGMSADDIQYNTPSTLYDEFENNSITVLNGFNENTIWFYAYQLIKNANNALVGLNNTQTLTPAVKDQLTGEAKFIRAFAYFYLVNLYGDVPMPLTGDADYMTNASLSRTDSKLVWTQIISDLKDAQSLLPAAYVGTFKARINKWAATALLARAYLYNQDWANAESQASQVINSAVYSLQTPANTFINTSPEIIWQVANLTGVSAFGANYLASAGVIPTYSMYDTLYNSFEPVDLRKSNWAGVSNIGGKNYYFVNKYKVRAGTGNEYNIMLRYAELYLIRAEARLQQNNLKDGKTDLEVIRTRAGLGALNASLNQSQLLLAVEQERKVELFGEWGHRWLDLKRTNRANAVIGGQKPTWKSTAVLYPIPENQRISNKNLTQNPGY